MNSEYEKLKAQNAADLAALKKPYQSIVYAIPQEQWEAMNSLLENNLALIPDLSTQANLLDYLNQILNIEQDSMNNATAKIKSATEQMTAELTNLTSQVGSYQELNSKAQKELMVSLLSQYQQMQSKLWTTLRYFLIGQTVLLATLLGLLIRFLR